MKINSRKSFICGLKGLKLSKKEINFLRKYKPWGIILFSRNIKNIKQVQILTSKIKKIFKDQNYPILIDEEGGNVSRLNKIIFRTVFVRQMLRQKYNEVWQTKKTCRYRKH